MLFESLPSVIPIYYICFINIYLLYEEKSDKKEKIGIYTKSYKEKKKFIHRIVCLYPLLYVSDFALV